MPYGLIVSIVLHMAILGWTLLSIENTPPFVETKPEPVEISMLLQERPVHPADLVVLTVGVVIALLRSAKLVAHQHQGHSLRQHQQYLQVPHLSLSKGQHMGVVRWSLVATVEAQVVVPAVAVVFAVGPVVLLVVAHQVEEREAIVAGHKVDRMIGVLRRFSI